MMMTDELVARVKQKREFRGLPESIVTRVLDSCASLEAEERVKEARRILRKYFGVFLTNRVLKPKELTDYDAVLRSHKSSHKRDYLNLYSRIQSLLPQKQVGSILDLGCGMNGFSYPYMREVFGAVAYLGVEASADVTASTQRFFDVSSCSAAQSLSADLFDSDRIHALLTSLQPPRLVFLFLVVDALESLEADSSTKLLRMLKDHAAFIVVSISIASLSGKTAFSVDRRWLVDFLHEHFVVLDDFVVHSERFFVVSCESSGINIKKP